MDMKENEDRMGRTLDALEHKTGAFESAGTHISYLVSACTSLERKRTPVV